MTPWRTVLLLAVEKARPMAVDGQIKGFELGDIGLVDVLEVGVYVSAGELGARVCQRGFGEGVVDRAEIKVNLLANGDFREIGGIEFQDGPVLKTHSDCDDGAS